MTCMGEPVSWPRLESYAADGLDARAAAAIAGHLEACEACRACLERLRADVVALPPLPAAAPAPRRARRFAWLGVGGSLALAAAVILLLVRPPGRELARLRTRVKGAGDVILEVVRERDGGVAYDPTSFRAGDRFKLRITCDPSSSVWADVVVFQGDEPASFPLPASPIPCGNAVTLPGAFAIDGAAPALVCVALDATGAPDRAAVAAGRGRTGGQLACAALAPGE